MKNVAKRAPLPGAKVRGSDGGRPIMALLDLLGRRWALRIVWDLREGPRRFRELAEGAGASPTALSARLAELRAAGLLSADRAEGYRLTDDGAALLRLFLPLAAWSEEWARRLQRRPPPDPRGTGAIGDAPTAAGAGRRRRPSAGR